MKQDNSWHKVFDITYISILRLYIWMYLHHKGSPSLQEMYVLLYNKLLCCLYWCILLHEKYLGQTLLVCCFSYLSQTHFRGSRGIILKIKSKTGQKLCENGKICRKIVYFWKYYILFPRLFPAAFSNECRGGSQKQLIT